MKVIVSLLTSAILAAFVYVGWQGISFVTIPAGKGRVAIDFEVAPGESFMAVANRLEGEGLVKSALYLKIYSKLKGLTQNIRVGEYELSDGMTPAEILRVLSSGKSKLRQFTIPEGQNIFEVAKILETQGYGSYESNLSLFRNQAFIKELLGVQLPSLEGYLFPETYSVTKYSSAEDIVRMMVNRFQQVWSSLDKAEGDWGLSSHEIVTFASIVEKETGAPEERPRISSVFHNRLKKKMRIQSDPTIIYGIAVETGKIIKNIRKKDILAKTPYNTYTIKALPIGPISNPGKEALQAVFKPESTDYLYFVSRNDGTHVFSSNLRDHNNAVREFQLRRSARQGKSWRDLKSRKRR